MKKHLRVLAFYVFFAILATFPLILKLKNGIYGPFFTTDLRGSVWCLWWLKYAFVHHLNPNFVPFVSAPFGYDLNLQNFPWISFAYSNGLVILTTPLCFLNISTLAGFILSAFLAYRLALILTKNELASIISGFLFAFSPYHLNKIPQFGFSFHGCWIVLYVLALFRLKEKTTFKNLIFTSVAFALAADFNVYYGFFCLVFTFGFLVFCSFYQWKDKLSLLFKKDGRAELKKRITTGLFFVGNISCVFLCALVIEFPILWSVVKSYLFSNSSAALHGIMEYGRSFDYLAAQSARPLSYLLPASTHPVFGEFTKSMFGSLFYGRGPIEQTLYLGWIPLILAFITFRQWKHKRSHVGQNLRYLSSEENFYIGFFIFSAWFAFFFSMPPIVDLGLFKLYLPSYFTYKILPMFRSYARFGVIVSLCVSVLTGYGIKFILERMKTKKMQWFFFGLLLLAIIFEFTNMPPARVTDLIKLPEVYAWLKQQPGDFIIAEYPMTKFSPGEAWTDYDYLFYQTKHQKRLVNGASLGTEAFEIKKKILKVEDKATPGILKALGTKYVILHTDQYRKGASKNVVEIIGEAPILDKVEGYRFFRAFGSDLVYEVVANKN